MGKEGGVLRYTERYVVETLLTRRKIYQCQPSVFLLLANIPH